MIHRRACLLSVLAAVVCDAAAVPRAAPADDPLAMVVGLLASADPDEVEIGLERVRAGITGEAATARLTAALPTLAPAAQIRLVAAIGDRGDRSALPAVKALLAATEDPLARQAALTTIGLLGGPAEVPLFVRLLAAAEPERTVARSMLVLLDGEATPAALFAASSSAAPAVRSQLIGILTDRNAWGGLPAALPALVAAAGDADEGVRRAALAAVAKAGGPDEVPGLVKALLAAADGPDRAEVERTLVAVCKRGDPPRAAIAFFALFTAASDAEREPLVMPLARIGGAPARGVVDALIDSGDPARRRSGIAAISRWPDGSVADRLLALLEANPDPAERDMLLDGLIRIAPLPDNTLKPERRLELMQKAPALARADADRTRIVERVHAIRSLGTLRFVAPFVDDPALAEAAARSVVELAHHRELRDANKEEFARALDAVLAKAKDAETRERAEAYKEGRTWKRK